MKIKSVQEELFACICVGLFIHRGNPFEDVSENNFDPSVLLISVDHQEEDLALKSPLITDKDGLHLFMSFNESNRHCFG